MMGLPNAQRNPSQVGLWLGPSWRTASRIGISENEYVHWVRLGLWNIEGDPPTGMRVRQYREIAGDQGWLLAAAGVSVEGALTQVAEVGIEDLLEAAEAMVALSEMADMLPDHDDFHKPEPEVEHVPPPKDTGPIDFSR